MSDGGGDFGGMSKGGGGGGSDSNFGGDFADYGNTPTYGSSSPGFGSGGSGADSSGNVNLDNPMGSSAYSGQSSSSAGPSAGEFVNDPLSGYNLTGPGPASGFTGTPGEGGGTNTPMSWDNMTLPNLNGVNASDFTGTPTSAGGVFDSGTGPVTSSAGFDNLVSGTPGGASAAGTAAPTGVSGNTDISSQSTNLTTAKPTNSGGSGGSNNGVMSSLGLGGGNGLGAAVAGAGLLNNLVNGHGAPPQSGALTANANSASATSAQQTSAGQALQQWQTTGTLPASYESQVQRAAQDAKTRAISNAAQQGLPTDPNQNTALAQQLNAIDAALPQQREQIAAQLAQSGQQMINAGLQATGISSGVYQTLANLENSQNQQRGQAIANFASALNGGGNRGLTLQLAK